MLDKSIPYFDVIMCLPSQVQCPPVPTLPDGYQYKLYTPGDETDWCATEASVGEFDNAPEAMEYFAREFGRHPAEMRRRIAFIQDASGALVANASAWWKDDEALGRIPLLHWVAVRPECQGLGLGRAVTIKALSLFSGAGPKGDIWLMTQTWSHVAIDLYVHLGFRVHQSARIAGHKNGFGGAKKVLGRVMREKTYAKMMLHAIP